MKFKKEIIAIMLVICMLFTISAISAADSSDDAISATNESVEVASADMAESNLATENNGEILAEGESSNVGTFTNLKNNISSAASGGTLELNNDYELSTSTDSAIVSNIGIDISKTLTIDGKGHYIDAKQKTNVFNLYGKVILKNIIFKNGKSGYGGFIYYETSQKCEIDNCTFINGYSTSVGGAVYSYGTSVDVFNSTFINNSATGGNGGALYISAYNFGNIENCTFINNSATGEGSAIHGYSDGTINNSIFINNRGNTVINSNSGTTASYNWFGNTIEDYEINVPSVGSGVTLSNYYVLDMSLDNDNGEATVSLNNLYENGALTPNDQNYILPPVKFNVKATGTTSYVDSVILGNSGVETFRYVPADAYSITISNSTVELSKEVKPTFILLNNQINTDGVSEITLEGDYEYDSSKDSSLTNGIAFAKDMTINGQGHIIDAKGLSNIFNFNDGTDSYNLIVKNIIFKNAVDENSAVIYFKGNKIEVINCTFLNNTANQGDVIHIIANSNENKITQSSFINNTCSNSVIYIDSDNACTIDDSILVNNIASYNIIGSSNVIADNNWWGNTQENNATDIANVDGVTVNKWLFLKIDATADITSTATVSLNNIYNGTSVGKYAEYVLPKISINVAGNGAALSKKSVALDNGEGTFNFMMTNTDATLTASYENINTNKELEYEIVEDGSFKHLNDIIQFTPQNGILNLNCDFAFVEGADDAYAGGISVLKGLTINGNNHTIDAKKKSAIFWLQSGNVFINNITFINAIGDGVLYNQADSLTVKYCDFINNTPSSGAVIYDNSESNFINCTFLNNSATNGGALYSHEGSTTFINSTFLNNSATKGGAFYMYNGNIKCENCTFGNNSATTAGVIYAYYGNVNCKNSTFENNNATNAGVFYNYYAKTSLNDCDIINNTANQGAVLYDNGYLSSFVNSRIIKNKAKSGSIIYGKSNTATADKCIFINNTASASVIYATSSYTLKNSIVLNNSVNSIIDGTYTQQITANNNWFGNTFDNYTDSPMSGDILNNWLFLNIRFHNDYATVCLEQYTKSSDSISVYGDNNLPTFTLNINSTSLDLSGINNITLKSNGASDVSYSLYNEPGALTASYEQVSLTKKLTFGDFDIIQNFINNETLDLIELDRNYTYNIEDTITAGILINRNITIDGKGHTIDAKGKSRIFNLQASGISFKNIVFANGNTTYGPAIFYNYANADEIDFEIVNCTFVNNTATDSSSMYGGGAIFIKTNGGSFDIKDSNFINNSAYLSSSYSSLGGAIYLNTKNAEVSIYNNSFINNKGRNGGAIYVASDSSHTTVDKCIFIENRATATTGPSYGNAIVWKTTNDKENNVVKNSIFINNYNNNYWAFAFSSGSVTIDDNWWGNTEKNYKQLGQNSFVYYGGSITPNSWLFVNASVSSYSVLYNETTNIKYVLQSYSGENVIDFDNSKLPEVEFNVTTDLGELSKDIVSLGEEFTYKATVLGNPTIYIRVNNNRYEVTLKGPGIIPIVDEPYIIYANQGYNKKTLIKTANDRYNAVIISCNDSSLINLEGNLDIEAYSKEGTAKITFTQPELDENAYSSISYDLIVKVVKVPLTINVTNIEGNEITLNVFDEMDLDISFEVDPIHKGYAPAWNTLGRDFNSSIITFTYDDGVKPDNASYYPTGHIKAKAGGTTNLTIYSTSGKFTWENYTIKITVNRVPTEIVINNDDPITLNVDNELQISAEFYINGTLNDTIELTYESNDSSVVEITNSQTGTFKAVGNGTALITVRYEGNSTHDNSSKTVQVTVNKYNTTVNINSQKTLELLIDEDSQIDAGLSLNIGSLSYRSDNETIASVDSTGKITANGEGTTIITVYYSGDRKYNESSDTITVTVKKIITAITAEDKTIKATDIGIPVGAQINITDEPYAFTYSSDNKSVVTVTADGYLMAVGGGNAKINITYIGSDKYLGCERIITVTVNKVQSAIETSPVSTEYGQKITLNPIVKADGNPINVGYITYYIADTPISEPVRLGNDFVWTADRTGEFNITAKYSGSEKYNASEANFTVTSQRADIDLSIYVDEIVYGKNITGYITTNVKETYTVVIDDTHSFTVEAEAGQTSFSRFIKLDVKNGYNAEVKIDQTENYKANSSDCTFDVVQSDAGFNANASKETYTYGDEIRLNVELPEDATGKVEFRYLNGTFIDEIDITQTRQLSLDVLDVNSYEIIANYTGDRNYKNSTKNIQFSVIPSDNHVTVEVIADTYPNNVIVNVRADVDGIYNVDINGSDYEIEANKQNLPLKLAAGSYYANVTFNNPNYNVISQNTTFTLKKGIVNVIISVKDCILPENATVNVISNFPGTYHVTINETYSVDVEIDSTGAGAADITLPYGKNYIPTTSLADSENYTAIITADSFSVLKHENNIEVIVDNVNYPLKPTVKVIADVDGVYSVDVNGTVIDVEANGEGVEIELAAGEYYANITGYDSPLFDAIIKNASFAVAKKSVKITVNADNVSLPNKAVINVTADEDRVYSIDVNGTAVDIEVTGGEGSNTVDLPAGENYIAHVLFDNENYTAEITDATFNVAPQFMGDLTIRDVNYPQNSTIALSDYDNVTVTGEYYLLKPDLLYTIESIQLNISGKIVQLGEAVEKSYVKFEFDVNETSNVAVTVIYTVLDIDGAEHVVVSNTINYDVKIKDKDIMIYVSQATYPDNAKVTVNAEDGVYDVVVGDKTYNLTVSDATGSVDLDKLPAGDYTVEVKLKGNDDVKNTTSFNIKKAESEISMSFENNTISITAPGDATGTVEISIGDKNYTVDLSDERSVSVDLPAGDYNATVAYSGDDNYSPITVNETFTVPKTEADIAESITVLNGSTYATVTVNLPEDATGNVTVSVDGKNYTAQVANGTATVDVPDLDAGSHEVEITYSGDDKYASKTVNATFSVSKVDAKIAVSSDVLSGTSAQLTITLPKDATGNVTVTVNGKKYTAKLTNGKATVKLTNLAVGNNKAIVTYSGNGKYNGATKDTTVNVPALKLTAKNVIMLYHDGTTFKVKLMRGDKAVSGKTVTITVNGVSYKVKTNKNGYAQKLINIIPKKYSVTAKYGSLKVTKTLVVKPVIVAKNVAVKKSAKSLKIKVTLKKVKNKYLAGKKVTLKLNGKKYTAKTNSKGVATFKISKKDINKLIAGKKYMYKVKYIYSSLKKTVSVKR